MGCAGADDWRRGAQVGEIGPGAEGVSSSSENRVVFGDLRDNGVGVGRNCLEALSNGV